MLTIALTAAVSVLMVDRMIEPAQAQMCASAMELSIAVNKIEKQIRESSDTGSRCATPDDVRNTVMLWCSP